MEKPNEPSFVDSLANGLSVAYSGNMPGDQMEESAFGNKLEEIYLQQEKEKEEQLKAEEEELNTFIVEEAKEAPQTVEPQNPEP